MKKLFVFISLVLFSFFTLNAQVIKVDDLEKYAKQRYGDKWLDAAANLASELTLDQNKSLTYQEIIQCPGMSKNQIYVLMNYWVTATFAGQQSAITMNDKESGTIIFNATIDNIAQHTGTLSEYSVSITPVIKIDIKDQRLRVTYTVQNYDVLDNVGAGWIGALGRDDNVGRNTYGDPKRMKKDATDRNLRDEHWEIAKHYPFKAKDNKKRTSSKALVMTHAYSNVIMDKIENAVKRGIVGNENDDW